MKFYHGTNQHGLEETQKQGFLLHKRVIDVFKNVSPCTYLTPLLSVAKDYGDIVLEVEYDPYKNPEMNNYTLGSWQVRVYEPIQTWRVVKLVEMKGKDEVDSESKQCS